MDEPKIIHFQGRNPSEVLQFYFRQHWIRMVRPLMRVFLLSIILFLIAWSLFYTIPLEQTGSRHVIVLLMIGFFIVLQLEFLHRFYCYFLNLVIVTDRKVHRIKKTLLSLDTHQIVDLWSLQDVKKSQRGPMQNLFGFGSIILEAQDTQLRIHFCPDITRHYEALLHLMELHRRESPSSERSARAIRKKIVE